MNRFLAIDWPEGLLHHGAGPATAFTDEDLGAPRSRKAGKQLTRASRVLLRLPR